MPGLSLYAGGTGSHTGSHHTIRVLRLQNKKYEKSSECPHCGGLHPAFSLPLPSASSLGGTSMEEDSHTRSSLASIHELAYKFLEKNQLCRYAPLICNDFGVGFSFHWHTRIYFFLQHFRYFFAAFLSASV